MERILFMNIWDTRNIIKFTLHPEYFEYKGIIIETTEKKIEVLRSDPWRTPLLSVETKDRNGKRTFSSSFSMSFRWNKNRLDCSEKPAVNHCLPTYPQPIITEYRAATIHPQDARISYLVQSLFFPLIKLKSGEGKDCPSNSISLAREMPVTAAGACLACKRDLI